MSEAVDEKCAHFALHVVNTGPKSDELQPPGDWILSMPNCPSSPTTPQAAAAPPALLWGFLACLARRLAFSQERDVLTSPEGLVLGWGGSV